MNFLDLRWRNIDAMRHGSAEREPNVVRIFRAAWRRVGYAV
jgi:hypothetical protein